jgi:L-seryl-tRNA(Ser) seleniumtransferase
VYILAGPNAEEGPLTTQVLCDRAKAKNVPVVVDAAAEVLTVPNVHLQKGATLVAYSGGKCLRGPQAAGLLLGRKDLVRAAWVSSAPHHGFGRAMKVGKEEAVAMLTAVEMWVKRDHDGEWKRWNTWLDHIARRVSPLEGVTTEVVQPDGLSNKTPSLLVLWDRARYGTDGESVAKHLFETEPRVALFPAGRRAKDGRTGVSITPYMLAAGEEKTVADRLFAALSSPTAKAAPAAAAPAADLSGEWTVRIQYAATTSVHTLYLRQRGNDLDGAHQGDFVAREVSGTIDGEAVRLRSSYEEDHGDALNFTFTGKVKGDELAGDLDMGEYLKAQWTARRPSGRA